MITINTNYNYIEITHEEWGVMSQKVLHIKKTSTPQLVNQVRGVQVKKANTLIQTIDFDECTEADILITHSTFGSFVLNFVFMTKTTGASESWVTLETLSRTIGINSRMPTDFNVVPKCTGQVVEMSATKTLFTPPTANYWNGNINILWGIKDEADGGISNYKLQILENSTATNLSGTNSENGTNNTHTQWQVVTISTANCAKIANGAKLQIVDTSNNNEVLWQGQPIKELNLKNANQNHLLQCVFNNFFYNTTYIVGGLIVDNETYKVAEAITDYYGEQQSWGLKPTNTENLSTTIKLPNLTKYDIYIYTNLLAICTRYLLPNKSMDAQNVNGINELMSFETTSPDATNNGVITITIKRYEDS